MNSRRWLYLLLAFIALIQTAAGASAAESPASVTKALYQEQIKNSGYTPQTVKAIKEWLTPDLYAHLWKQVNSKKQNSEDPAIDCDVILCAQDVPDKFEVGRETIDKSAAKVEVMLAWGKDKRRFEVRLKQVEGAWKVDDIDFGKEGTLRGLLK